MTRVSTTHRLRRLLPALALVAVAGLAVQAAPGAAANQSTTVYPFSCSSSTPFGTIPGNAFLDMWSDASVSVEAGGDFTAMAAPTTITLPTTFVVMGQTVTLNSERDITIGFAVPEGATVTSATLSGGSNLGAGTPTVSQTASLVQLTLPGPFSPGDNVNPPLLTLGLHATGAVSSTVLTAFDPGSAAYTYDPNVTVLGQTFDAPTACSPSTSPVLRKTVIVAVGDPAPQGDVSGCTVNEGGTCDFHVTLSWPRGVPVSVNYATVDGTAKDGTRYTGSAWPLSLFPGDTDEAISVPTIADNIQHPDQTFQVQLTNPVGLTLGTTTATGTIHDTSPAPYVIAQVGVVHRTSASGTQMLRIPVELATRWGKPITSGYDITVHWTTGDYTAHAPGDYTASSGDVVFSAGSSATQFIDVPVPASTGPAAPSLFVVGLTSPQHAIVGGIGPGLGFGLISNDPAA